MAYWDSCDREVANLANALGEHLKRLFTILEEAGVEPTNNAAEQALRTAVQRGTITLATAADEGKLPSAAC